jgi:NADH-quinone oxidoreductase subunit I
MADNNMNHNYPIMGISIGKLKPKLVRKHIELTLWERLYIFEIIRGMQITTKHFFKNLIGFIVPPKGKKRSIMTVYYPEEKLTLPSAYRGRPVLVMRENGTEKCVACGLCEKICPASAISIIAEEKENGERFPAAYTLDMARCVFCGYCEEVCPKEAIVMSAEYEGLARRNRQNLRFTKDKLLKPEKSVKDRIEYIRGIYAKCNY